MLLSFEKSKFPMLKKLRSVSRVWLIPSKLPHDSNMYMKDEQTFLERNQTHVYKQKHAPPQKYQRKNRIHGALRQGRAFLVSVRILYRKVYFFTLVFILFIMCVLLFLLYQVYVLILLYQYYFLIFKTFFSISLQ